MKSSMKWALGLGSGTLALLGMALAPASLVLGSPAAPSAGPAGDAAASGPSFAQRLAAKRAELDAQTPTAIALMSQKAMDEVRASGITAKAIQVGQAAPDFSIPSAKGGTLKLAELRAKGPVVLLWYRGGWCPYCNLTLQAYGERAADFQAQGATVVALSAEKADRALTTAEKLKLPYEVGVDADDAVAKAYGVLFPVQPWLWGLYKAAIGVDAYYSHGRAELPLAATYVIDQQGQVAWAYLDADYRNRAEPEAVLAALAKLPR